MEDLLALILTEQWFLWMLLVLILWAVWYWIYKVLKVSTTLLKDTLSSFLDKFSEMVGSISELSRSEDLSRKVQSDEHNKIMNVLENIHTDIRVLHNEKNND